MRENSRPKPVTWNLALARASRTHRSTWFEVRTGRSNVSSKPSVAPAAREPFPPTNTASASSGTCRDVHSSTAPRSIRLGARRSSADADETTVASEVGRASLSKRAPLQVKGVGPPGLEPGTYGLKEDHEAYGWELGHALSCADAVRHSLMCRIGSWCCVAKMRPRRAQPVRWRCSLTIPIELPPPPLRGGERRPILVGRIA